jgi:hypothetical protein
LRGRGRIIRARHSGESMERGKRGSSSLSQREAGLRTAASMTATLGSGDDDGVKELHPRSDRVKE